jgi:asparagine synthase (glutamine-hydrolysing)
MCGFVGFFAPTSFASEPRASALIDRMSGCIRHRGPDSGGRWLDPEAGIALGHRRLAIVDLSPAGEQPMASPSGRYIIVYNGELYNHLEVRAELQRSGAVLQWRGHSDTETLLAAFDAWGVTGALERSIGMFAFALWDGQEKALILARDRIGEKPLYYGWQGRGEAEAFLFGSELKALAAHPSFEREISRDSLSLYMRHNCVPGPYSIYRGIAKLMPGFIATLRPGQREPELHRYWSAAAAAEAGVADPLRMGAEESVDALEQLLMGAVGQQMMSDVPLGAFLSGGIDSSTVVALMQAQSTRPVKTFTIGFHEAGYNEAVHAKAVAEHLGTDHTELYVTPDQAMEVIPRLPTLYDEPFADSSQIPTFLVSELARRHVTVSLSGDAGDELFGGYNRYTMTKSFWRSVSRVPRPFRKGLARGITSLSPAAWDSVAARLRRVTPKSAQSLFAGDKLHKSAGIMASRSIAEVYRGLASHWTDPAAVVIGGAEPATLLTGDLPRLEGLNDIERMMALDLLTYLPDDILVKVDRAAMGVSLETRVPFLDHRVVEFAWRLPLDMKIRDGQSKWPLRQLLYRHVPKELIERPKAGFGVPIGEWLRGPMRDWAEALLNERRLRDEGYFYPGPIGKMWAAHQAGQVNAQHHLWDVLMFQSWLETQRSGAGAGEAPMPAAGRRLGGRSPP